MGCKSAWVLASEPWLRSARRGAWVLPKSKSWSGSSPSTTWTGFHHWHCSGNAGPGYGLWGTVRLCDDHGRNREIWGYMGKMHADEADTDADLVRRLLPAQFPQWADLPITRLASGGTVNAIYRLGEDLTVRLPLRPGGAEAIAMEARLLPGWRRCCRCRSRTWWRPVPRVRGTPGLGGAPVDRRPQPGRGGTRRARARGP